MSSTQTPSVAPAEDHALQTPVLRCASGRRFCIVSWGHRMCGGAGWPAPGLGPGAESRLSLRQQWGSPGGRAWPSDGGALSCLVGGALRRELRAPLSWHRPRRPLGLGGRGHRCAWQASFLFCLHPDWEQKTPERLGRYHPLLTWLMWSRVESSHSPVGRLPSPARQRTQVGCMNAQRCFCVRICQ